MNERLALLRTVAEDARRSKSAFVSRVSHELRTPLNMIIGLVRLIVESPEIYSAPVPSPRRDPLVRAMPRAQLGTVLRLPETLLPAPFRGARRADLTP